MLKKIWDFFDDDDITIYSAGLSFFTLFSTIPLLIFVFTIFASMPLFHEIYAEFKLSIFEFILPQKSGAILEFLDSFVAKDVEIEYMYLGYVAVISMMFFKYYEHVVEKIFESRHRNIVVVAITYVALILFIPILFIYLLIISSMLDWVYSAFFVSWAMFAIIYYSTTPSQYGFKSVLIGSFGSSFAWYITKNLYVYYVQLNTTYPTLYGSFSTIFFSLFWIYISWMIYLYGLKLIKSVNGYHQNQQSESVS